MPRDLTALRVALEQIPTLKQTLATVGQASPPAGLLTDEPAKKKPAKTGWV